MKAASEATKHIVKKSLKEDEVIKNAATKHILTGMKGGEGHTENMHKVTTVSEPGKEKMAKATTGSATKIETEEEYEILDPVAGY